MELQIRGVSKTDANGVRALKDVTLTIPSGMYGLLGPNGDAFRGMCALPQIC
jgi:ABC-2 type transport system ATP-binding protein